MKLRIGFFSLVLTCVAFVAPALLRAEQQEPRSKRSEAAPTYVGTWRMVSFKYGDAKEFTELPKEVVYLKHVTPTHFEWSTYDAKTKKILRAAGGTYRFDGGRYIEHLEYALGADVEPLIGKDQVFDDKVEGNHWHHLGALSTGFKIEENWERLHGGAPNEEKAAGADQSK